MLLKIYRLTGKFRPTDKHEITCHVFHKGNIHDVQRDIAGDWRIDYVAFVKGKK